MLLKLPVKNAGKNMPRLKNKTYGMGDTKMKYNIHVTNQEGELIETIVIDTKDKYWDSAASKSLTKIEIYEAMYKAEAINNK